jgi:hypothetical protein
LGIGGRIVGGAVGAVGAVGVAGAAGVVGVVGEVGVVGLLSSSKVGIHGGVYTDAHQAWRP